MMEIKIGSKRFNLEKVSIYISDLYLEYVRLTNEPLTLDAELKEIELEASLSEEEAETKGERLRAQLKFIRDVKAMKIRALDLAKEAAGKRDEIIKEIVELNGYEYSSNDWIKHFSDGQFTDLIEDLLVSKKKGIEQS